MCTLTHTVPRSTEYPSWDWRESRDFDELNHILRESKKLGKALESLSRSECAPLALFTIPRISIDIKSHHLHTLPCEETFLLNITLNYKV